MQALRYTKNYFRVTFGCNLWALSCRSSRSLWSCGHLETVPTSTNILPCRISVPLPCKQFCSFRSLLNKEQDGSGKVPSDFQPISSKLDGDEVSFSTDNNESWTLDVEDPGNADEKLQHFKTEYFDLEVLPENFGDLPTKCCGCGAIFQSVDPEKPGYIMREKNPELNNGVESVRTPVCQRCFQITHYNKATPTVTSQLDVMRYLRHIRSRKALILYLVDIMDIPSSLFNQLLETVGETKRIIIVGNKVDMLPIDGRVGWQEQRLKEAVLSYCEKHGLKTANVKGVSLISARTGYGMSQLLRQIREHWDRNGDIYLLGCSNTGKTTLFNLLLDLLNAHKGGDMLQRATVSLAPGTTLSLLRFPVGHWMLHKLSQRLHRGVEEHRDSSGEEIQMDQEIMPQQLTDFRDTWQNEDRDTLKLVARQQTEPWTSKSEIDLLRPQLVLGKDERRTQHWFYDTPGIVSSDQVTQFLTMEELKLLNPQLWIVPRTYILKPGQVILLGGLARLDYIEVKRKSRFDQDETDEIAKANQSIYFTVFVSPNLPVHVTNIARVDQVYEKHAGTTDILMIPRGGAERMASFPKLESRDFSFTAIGWKESAADVVLSNIGWVAVTGGSGSEVSLKAYTPSAVGLDLREPALLPTSVRQRGKRGARYQGRANLSAYEGTRRSSPQFVKYLEHGNRGTYQWVAEAKRRRKEQRILLKQSKINSMIEKSLGHSAVANPPYIEGAVAYPKIKKLKEPQKKLQ